MFGNWRHKRGRGRKSRAALLNIKEKPFETCRQRGDVAPKTCCLLADVPPGACCRIRRHRGRGAVRQRLLDLGFVPSAKVRVLRKATLGDPIELLVDDTFVTLRKNEAAQIEVDP